METFKYYKTKEAAKDALKRLSKKFNIISQNEISFKGSDGKAMVLQTTETHGTLLSKEFPFMIRLITN